MSDFTDAELHMIGQIMKAERTMPDEFWCVGVVQELACLLVKLEPMLSDEAIATLIGAGAVIARQGKAEMMAEIEMKIALAKAQDHRP